MIPSLQASARIRFFADWVSTSLDGYAAAPADYEQTHRTTYRNWLAGDNTKDRDDYRDFLQSSTCNFQIDFEPGTQHPNFNSLYGPINAAIEGLNSLKSPKFASIDEDTEPTCKQYVEQPDGTVTVEYNWDLDLLPTLALPKFPFPKGSYRVHVQYDVDSEL